MRVYIGATRQNDGKTIVSLGLIGSFIRKLEAVGYIKPVGQQYVKVDGEKIDKDAVLMKEIYGLTDELKFMNPVAVPKGFTERYILRGNKDVLRHKIQKAFNKIKEGKDIVLIEGTGHAGVGSVFDMSNSDVARILKSKAILVSCGGIGRPIDEIMLNKAMFDQKKIELLGVIINKIQEEKYDKISKLVRRGLEKKGIRVLGLIPFEKVLSNPTIDQLLEDIKGDLICGEKGLKDTVSKFVIGAMPPHDALDYLGGDTLLITPGNRDDLILAALSGETTGLERAYGVSGMILTCGFRPHRNVERIIRRTNIPVILVPDDTFEIATKINNLIVKVRSTDKKKIRAVEKLVDKYVDVERIFDLIKRKG